MSVTKTYFDSLILIFNFSSIKCLEICFIGLLQIKMLLTHLLLDDLSRIDGNRNEKSSTRQNKFLITGMSDILLLHQFHRQCHFNELITEKQCSPVH